ncbi:unnamed protein product [Moneuplotes crassus]|uniref:nicotinamidase n=1 Tax=Euplotes crassus TaxID=5936 RepID=A0AAD2D2Y7_EUPCR|nr:unnamed protein product [Moneuplotes crassus]
MDSEKKALIVVDVQNDFCEGGSLAVKDAAQIFPIINSLKKNTVFEKVYLTADWHPADHVSFHENNPGTELFQEITLEETGVKQVMWPTHCVQDKTGSEFHKDLEVSDSDVIVKKGTIRTVDSYSGFGTPPEDTGLNQLLQDEGITTVYVTGLAYDYCVGSTARDAAKNGYKTYVVTDATKSIAEETAKAMDDTLSGLGVEKIESSSITA